MIVGEAQSEVGRARDVDRLHGALRAGEVRLRVRDVAVDAVPVAPLVRVGAERQEAELPALAQEPPVTAGDLALDVRGEVFGTDVDVTVERGGQLPVDLLGVRQRGRAAGAAQRVEDVDLREAAPVGLDRVADLARQRPRAVVLAHAVVVAAPVGQAVVAAAAVPAGVDLDAEHAVLRHLLGADIDVAAAERGRHLRREALLHRERVDDVRREDVEGQHVARQVRRGDRGAVQQRARVSFAEPTHVDELPLRHRQPWDAAERLGDVAVADARDALGVEHVHRHVAVDTLRDDVGRRGLETAQDDDLLDGVGIGAFLRRGRLLPDRRCAVPFLRPGPGAGEHGPRHGRGQGPADECSHLLEAPFDVRFPGAGVTRTTTSRDRWSSWRSSRRRPSRRRGSRRPCRRRRPCPRARPAAPRRRRRSGCPR